MDSFDDEILATALDECTNSNCGYIILSSDDELMTEAMNAYDAEVTDRGGCVPLPLPLRKKRKRSELETESDDSSDESSDSDLGLSGLFNPEAYTDEEITEDEYDLCEEEEDSTDESTHDVLDLCEQLLCSEDEEDTSDEEQDISEDEDKSADEVKEDAGKDISEDVPR
jgi:hypothetical protein